MLVSFSQVITVFYSNDDVVPNEVRHLVLNSMKAGQICLNLLGPAANGAKRTKQMLLAGLHLCKSHLAYGVVVMKNEVITAIPDLLLDLAIARQCAKIV